jgi:hypothetical protein
MAYAKPDVVHAELTDDEHKQVMNIIAGIKSMVVDTEPHIVGSALCGVLAQLAAYYGSYERKDVHAVINAWAQAQKQVADKLLTKKEVTTQ